MEAMASTTLPQGSLNPSGGEGAAGDMWADLEAAHGNISSPADAAVAAPVTMDELAGALQARIFTCCIAFWPSKSLRVLGTEILVIAATLKHNHLCVASTFPILNKRQQLQAYPAADEAAAATVELPEAGQVAVADGTPKVEEPLVTDDMDLPEYARKVNSFETQFLVKSCDSAFQGGIDTFKNLPVCSSRYIVPSSFLGVHVGAGECGGGRSPPQEWRQVESLFNLRHAFPTTCCCVASSCCIFGSNFVSCAIFWA